MNIILYFSLYFFSFIFKLILKIFRFTGLHIPIIIYFILRYVSHKFNVKPDSFMDYTIMIIFFLSFLPPIVITIFKIINFFRMEE